MLDVREPVRQRECELRDRIRACLRDMVAGNRHGVEVTHLIGDKVLLDVAHHFERKTGGEDTGVLRLIFLQDIGLNGASYGRENVGLDFFIGLAINCFVARNPQQLQTQRIVPFGQIR